VSPPHPTLTISAIATAVAIRNGLDRRLGIGVEV
jgi:hypothetical protein